MIEFDEKDFRDFVDACQAAARIPALEREIFELTNDLNATKCELDELRDEGEIVDNGEQLDLNE